MSNFGNQEIQLKKALLTKQKWEKLIETNALHPCKRCGESKPADQFVIQYMDNQLVGKYRYLYECRDCKRSRTYAKRAKKRTTITGTMDIVIKHLFQGAKKRKLDFAITKQDLLNLWEKQQGKCYYTGYEMQFEFVGYRKQQSWNEKAKFQVSCDRLDNTKGYFLENIVLCCTFVNKMKGILSEQEFYTVCQDILSHRR